jgi:hypothetical protein
MDFIVEEIIGTYIGPYTSPLPFLAAAASIVVLLSGLGARIVELGQAARWAHRECNRRTFSPDPAPDRTPPSNRRITVNMNRRTWPLFRDPSDKTIGGVCSERASIIHPLCVLNGFNGPRPQPARRNNAPSHGEGRRPPLPCSLAARDERSRCNSSVRRALWRGSVLDLTSAAGPGEG